MKVERLSYHLCPRCFRATPAGALEHFCPNDGTRLLTSCPDCGAVIGSPYSRHCSNCGRSFSFDAAQQSGTRAEPGRT